MGWIKIIYISLQFFFYYFFFRNDEVQKLQSNICGQLGSIVLVLNYIFHSLSVDKKPFKDILIDDHLSSVDAAIMVKPYLRAEEKDIENTLKQVYKVIYIIYWVNILISFLN